MSKHTCSQICSIACALVSNFGALLPVVAVAARQVLTAESLSWTLLIVPIASLPSVFTPHFGTFPDPMISITWPSHGGEEFSHPEYTGHYVTWCSQRVYCGDLLIQAAFSGLFPGFLVSLRLPGSPTFPILTSFTSKSCILSYYHIMLASEVVLQFNSRKVLLYFAKINTTSFPPYHC